MKIERLLTIFAFIGALGGGAWWLFDRIDFVDSLMEAPPWEASAERQWVNEQLSAHLGAGHNVSGDISSALAGPQVQIDNMKATLERLNEQLDILNARMGDANVKIGSLGTAIDGESEELDDVARRLDAWRIEFKDTIDELEDDLKDISNRPWVRAPIAGQ